MSFGQKAVSNPNSQATWSPGGAVAYSDLIEQQPALVIIQENQTRQVIETEVLPFYLHWAPSEDHIVFLGSSPAGLEAGVARVSELRSERLDVGGPFYFDWHPDDPKIIAHVGATELREYAVDGTVRTVVPTTGVFQAPQWTSEGVLFGLPGRVSITARGLSGRLQSSATDVFLGTPGGDASLLATMGEPTAFDRSSTGRIAISEPGRLIVVDDGTPRKLISGELVLAFQWSPDGHKLAYLEQVADLSFRWVVWTESEFGDVRPFHSQPYVLQRLPTVLGSIQSIPDDLVSR